MNMNIFKMIFGKKEKWTELNTLYSSERMENICIYLAEQNVPYKIRAALLPIPLNTAAPLGATTQSMWYLSVHPDDVGKVHQVLRQEKMG